MRTSSHRSIEAPPSHPHPHDCDRDNLLHHHPRPRTPPPPPPPSPSPRLPTSLRRPQITFFPPSSIDGLYPYPVDHPLFRRARVDLYQEADERDARFPAFGARAEKDAQVVELGEGDVVLFPRYWWHHVETVSELSCSVGCRYVS